ncbi:DNA polymerase III subunit beta [candidate division WOR-1 bacterium RIFOXYB2_FULL_42_35]|uniref:Beta sliding clamp n=1 Tax=candidate division WOR-1 bacterium RIFOXYC2_FULL_41_25 TaxID=1802586 RepID=A0A1F4TJ76_UNCSA|nr:MAG: DNA polymerase III subunit beta [candidate division WOR-1 bacterium RIFOXYA2_FULL_41_14]OGC21958.1 MAG: DNA polymerase III subunit beta [candidate division WOR-1 bacterium RIFOXYB2_FULL_42_35]OGC32791.1 MAG: DNA polymerase III subunit beta [candidate division WOR-1 bacterium RIFOXYC2_FULL_41_25]OGC41349.1 MAG: DNA polymerase III subunit beta [candidate division WOR-1 bacterium RIFOXYD2_FULL_41_8]
MEFICERKKLQTGVSAVDRIVATRSTLPIIGNLLFETKKNTLKISANNLEIGIELGLEAKVEKEGAALIPAKTFAGIVSKLPESNISFKLMEKGAMRVSYNNSFFNINILPPDEFPMLPKVKDGKSFNIDAQVFIGMIRQVIFAVSSNEDKYVLTGVLLEVGKGSMTGDSSNVRMVSTDGYRLVKRSEKIKLDEEVKISAIVPAKALQEIARIIDSSDAEGEVKITISKDQIAFKYKEVYLVSRLIQGQFPDYKQVFPKKSSTKVVVKTKNFLEAAERAAVVASGSANIVRFETKDGEVHLVASTPDVGSIDEIIEAEIKGNSKFQIAFNIRLITDMLKTVTTDSVVVELTETLGPGVIKQSEKGEFLYIVMPIRTQEAA